MTDLPSANIRIGEIPAMFEQHCGRKPALSTVKRWIKIGYRGVKLRVAGPTHFRFTKAEWIEKFIHECGNVDSAEVDNSVRTEEDMRRTKRARVILRSLGIMK